MAATPMTTIASDEQAIALLRTALESDLDDGAAVQFQGWPTVGFKLTGAHYHGTITAGQAQALLDFQRAVEHAYVQLVAPATKRLTAQEKRQLAVTARAQEGSSLVTYDLNEALTHIASQLIGKMSPSDIIITVLGLGVIAGSTVVAKAYLKERSDRLAKDADLQSRLALSQHEIERMKVLADAIQRQPRLAVVKDDFDEARDGVLRSSVDASAFELEGLALSPVQAGAMARQPRSRSQEAQLNGVYIITGVTWPDEEAVLLDLRATDKTLEFKASLSTMSLLQRDKDLIAKAEWSRTPLYLQVNARLLRGDVASATIVGFDWDKLRET